MVNARVGWPAATAARTKGRRVVPGRRRVEAVNAAVDAVSATQMQKLARGPMRLSRRSDTLSRVRTHTRERFTSAAVSRAADAVPRFFALQLLHWQQGQF